MRSTVPSLVLAALLLSACGASSGTTATGEATKPVAQIIRDEQSAVRSARSVHYAISISGHGTAYEANITKAAPKRITGYYTAQRGYKITFMRDGSRLYLRSAPWIWAALVKPGAAALAKTAGSLVNGTWLLMPPNLSQGFTVPTPSQYLDQVLRAGNFLSDGDTTYNGRTLLTLQSGTGKLYLRPGRPDYPVAFVDDADGAQFRFDHWNAPLRVTAPNSAVDLAKLPNFPKPSG
jgi:hypothetical protein